MAIFQTMDIKGKVIKKTEKSFDHYKRYSMRASAEQRLLDSLVTPDAVEARIVFAPGRVLYFKIKSGRSMHYYPDGQE